MAGRSGKRQYHDAHPVQQQGRRHDRTGRVRVPGRKDQPDSAGKRGSGTEKWREHEGVKHRRKL